MTTLVVGADGQLGTALSRLFTRVARPFLATTRRRESSSTDRVYLDLLSPPSEWRLPETIDAAVVCAAASKSDACERDPVGTRRVNVEGTVTLAREVAKRGGRIIFLSSNQVFDGSAMLPSIDTPVSPITEYGRQKAEAEAQLMSLHPSAVTILRLTKVLGKDNALFTEWMRALRGGETIRPFRDMHIAPIPVTAVTSVVSLLLELDAPGIFHLSAERDVPYDEVALHALRATGATDRQVVPVNTRDVLGSQPFPRYSALGMDATSVRLGLNPPTADWTLSRAFDQSGALESIT